MENINFEILLGNVSFILLFAVMIFYWLEANFYFFSRFHFLAFSTTIIANFSLLILLLIRWITYGHFPLSNMFESLIFLSWSLTLLQLILEKLSKNNFLGAIISPIALFSNSFAAFSLPPELQKASVLVPALQSNWLMMHVTVMMLSYAALLGGSLLAIAFLILTVGQNINLTGNSLGLVSTDFDTNREFQDNFLKLKPFSPILKYETGKTKQFEVTTEPIDYKLAKTLDNLSYRTLGIGFPLLTIGILSGAVWANEACINNEISYLW